ncbi:MAG: hypothetical protein ACTSU0_06355 [Alphaproteobacteria bacterium]
MADSVQDHFHARTLAGTLLSPTLRSNIFTLVRGVRLIGQESGQGMAMVVISILPPLQRRFFRGLAA